RLREELDSVEPTARPADLTSALRRAERLLSSADHSTRTIYLVSTVPAAALDGDPPWAAGAGPALVVVDPSDGDGLDNAAVIGLEAAPAPGAGPQVLTLTAEIVFRGASAARRDLALELDGAPIARGVVDLTPGQAVRKQFTAVLPPGTRSARLAVVLEPDALPLDDRRFVVATARATVPVLLIDGDPRTRRHDDEIYYLAAALRPGDRDDGGASLTTATVADLSELELA